MRAARADRLDDTGAVAARRVGQRRQGGVLPGAQVGVDGVHAGGVQPHEHLAWARWPQVGHLVDLQDLGFAEAVDTDRAHRFSLV